MTFSRPAIERLIATVESGLQVGELGPYAEGLRACLEEADGWRRKAEVALKLFGETQDDVARLTAERDGMAAVVEAAERWVDNGSADLTGAVDAWRARKAGGG
jgi:hypothetical protein